MKPFECRKKADTWVLKADGVHCSREHINADLVVHAVSLGGTHGQQQLQGSSFAEADDLVTPVTRECVDFEDLPDDDGVPGRFGTPVGYFRALLQLTLERLTPNGTLVSTERVWAVPDFLLVEPQLQEIHEQLAVLNAHRQTGAHDIATQIASLQADAAKLVYPTAVKRVDSLVGRERTWLHRRSVVAQRESSENEALARLFRIETDRIRDTTQLLLRRYFV